MDIRFTGHITALQPISISKPDANEAGVVTRVRNTPAGPQKQLIIAGDSLRGKLRHTSMQIFQRAYAVAQGKPAHTIMFDMVEYNFYAVGGVKDGSSQDVEDLVRSSRIRNANPFFALWGAGQVWITGRAAIGDATPETAENACVDKRTGVRGDAMRRDPDLLAQFSDEDKKAYDEYSRARKKITAMRAELKETKRALASFGKAAQNEKGETRSELDKRAKALDKAIKDDNASLIFGNSLLTPLNWAALAAGSRLDHKMKLTRVTPEEAGLFIQTLLALSDDCRIGGKASVGCGEFEASWNISIRDNAFEPYRDAGVITVSPDDAEIEIRDPAIQTALDAWANLAREINARCDVTLAEFRDASLKAAVSDDEAA
jgi:CRISPR type IV-associated protein Csf2